MITNARVLQADFVPREVVHRDAEVNALSGALAPITDGDTGETAFLFGPSGTGKTCLAQFTAARLREEVLDLDYQYVNCWRDHSRFKTLYRILEGIDRAYDIHRQGTPHDELLDRVHEYDGSAYVVVLDEVDQLEDKRLLYDLYRVPKVTMVLIANREADLFAQLDDRLVSRLHSARRISFDKYGIDELVAILRRRADSGLKPGAIDRDGLEFIADTAGGDARIAIGILRSAARTATERERDSITDDVLDAAVPEAREEVHQRNLDTLTDHQRALYDIIDDHGEIEPGDLYDHYRKAVTEPKTRRTVRNYLTKMVQYDLVVASGENRARTYRLRD